MFPGFWTMIFVGVPPDPVICTTICLVSPVLVGVKGCCTMTVRAPPGPTDPGVLKLWGVDTWIGFCCPSVTFPSLTVIVSP